MEIPFIAVNINILWGSSWNINDNQPITTGDDIFPSVFCDLRDTFLSVLLFFCQVPMEPNSLLTKALVLSS